MFFNVIIITKKRFMKLLLYKKMTFQINMVLMEFTATYLAAKAGTINWARASVSS
jgi:hypothetical protein